MIKITFGKIYRDDEYEVVYTLCRNNHTKITVLDTEEPDEEPQVRFCNDEPIAISDDRTQAIFPEYSGWDCYDEKVDLPVDINSLISKYGKNYQVAESKLMKKTYLDK